MRQHGNHRTPYPSIERLRLLAMLLRQHRAFTAGEVARECESSRKTIVRDLAFLRDRLGYEYRYEPGNPGGHYKLQSAPAPVL